MKKYVLRQRIFLVLSVVITGFIFGQTLFSSADSHAQSGRIAAMLLYVLQGLSFRPDPDAFHLFIRKLAHFIEFGALGVCVGGYAFNRGCLQGRSYLAMPAYLTLLVAVCDEFLQSFTGRSSLVSDVVLDYSGAILGLSVTAAFVFIKKKIKRRNEHEN